jgi:hypothetical protein
LFLKDTDQTTVDRSDAPFLPPMKVLTENNDSYVVEASFPCGLVTAAVPKHLLPQNDQGVYVAMSEISAQLMK